MVGGITPIAALASGVPAMPTRSPEISVVVAVAFTGVGLVLRSVARKLLGALKQAIFSSPYPAPA